MVARLYTKARQKFLEAEIDLIDDTIKASLIDVGGYSANLSSDEYFDDIPAISVVATQTLTGITTTDGVFNAADVTFVGVPATANTIEIVVIWKDTGNTETSPLISYDEDAIGLPTTPNDGNITVVWNEGINKIFRLN